MGKERRNYTKSAEKRNEGGNNERSRKMAAAIWRVVSVLSLDTLSRFERTFSRGGLSAKCQTRGLPLAQCLDSVRQGSSSTILKNTRSTSRRTRARTSANRDLLPSPVSNKAQTMPWYAYSFEEPRGGTVAVLGKARRP